jgi:hypothetical protein
MAETFDDPELLTSLSQYSYARHAQLTAENKNVIQERMAIISEDQQTTFLFLQIHAAADYFSLNKTLMDIIPPVAVDIILDPYILNVFPKSLLPTAGYIIVIATGSWFLSAWISKTLKAQVNEPVTNLKKTG